jgi:hypothetical protein
MGASDSKYALFAASICSTSSAWRAIAAGSSSAAASAISAGSTGSPSTPWVASAMGGSAVSVTAPV